MVVIHVKCNQSHDASFCANHKLVSQGRLDLIVFITQIMQLHQSHMNILIMHTALIYVQTEGLK